MDEIERAFHESLKPSWDINGTLVYAAPGSRQLKSRGSRAARDRDDLLVVQKGKVVSEARDIMFARFAKEVSIP
jgi:nuclear pore complex protein Nup98-Nup96